MVLSYCLRDVDLIKLDCVFGGNWTPQTLLEIEAFSRAIQKAPREMALSLSPGGAMTAEKLDKVVGLATTARMAVDLHGEFYMIYPQYFDIAEKWHSYIPNATTSNGSSMTLFLDFGILPFGKGKEMHLTISEMRVVMSLWCMVRSPLIYGGAVVGPKAVDPQILRIVTNADILRVADDVQQPTLLRSQHEHIITWMAFSASDPATTRYVAVFNLGQKTHTTQTETTDVKSVGLMSPSCHGLAFKNDTCFHNPRGKLFGLVAKDPASCCEACKNYTKARCVAWSAFHNHGALECFLFGSVGKVNRVSGCVSGGTDSPAPAPAPFSGENVSLSALQLNESKAWTARSIWDPRMSARVTNGFFVSLPSYHDVNMYVVSAQ